MNEWIDERDVEENFDLGPRDAGEAVAFFLQDLECIDNEANRRAALKAERIVEVVRLARAHPEVYVDLTDAREARDFAERSVLLDIALRLRCSEDHARGTMYVAEQAMTHLPLLWREARNGFASMHLVQRAVASLSRVKAPVGAPREAVDAERESMRLIDAAAAEWVHACPPATFVRRLRTLLDRLDPQDASTRHAHAMKDRRVVVDDVEDGMSWFMALIPTADALAAKRRLTSTAKHLQKDRREGRTRDQIRADLFSEWLRGVGTATAVKTELFVTVPVQLLDRAVVGDDAGSSGPVTVERAQIVGHGPIDDVTAMQMFLDAKAFRRIITDPIRGVALDMDRRTYRPTKSQRDWLILQHGRCSRDGCERLAVEADIDHDRPWSQGGKTDIADLRPLCPRDHRHNHMTRAVYRTRPDATVEVVTPTGFHTRPEPADLTVPPF